MTELMYGVGTVWPVSVVVIAAYWIWHAGYARGHSDRDKLHQDEQEPKD